MVYYIYHSAFVIELKKSILIFDFYRFPSNKKKEKEEFFNITAAGRKEIPKDIFDYLFNNANEIAAIRERMRA